MSDLIDRQRALSICDSAIDLWTGQIGEGALIAVKTSIAKLPSVQPELCEDAVSRQRLLSDLKELIAAWKKYPIMAERIKGVEAAIGYVKVIPSVKPDSKELSSTHKALDTISRQAAIDVLKVAYWDNDIQSAKDDPCIVDAMTDWAIRQVKALPSAEPEPLSDAYMKAVWTWLLDYQTKVAELKGRYTPYEVLSWVANDWRKEHEQSD